MTLETEYKKFKIPVERLMFNIFKIEIVIFAIVGGIVVGLAY